MPCNTIRRTRVTFEKVAYQPGHMALMLDALKALGYQTKVDVPPLELRSRLPLGLAVKIWPVGTTATTRNTILYQDGKLQIPSTLRDRFTVDAVKEAYAREAVKLHARRNGWLLREISPTEYEVTKR